jgi:hypothetical protein
VRCYPYTIATHEARMLDQDTTRQLTLLAAYRRTLAVELRQQAELGVLAPAGVVNGIAEIRFDAHVLRFY